MDLRRSVNTRVWNDDWFETLEPNFKLLWLYLLTNTHTNMLGIYEVTLRRISFETGLNEEIVRKGFESLQKALKAFIILEKFVFLPNWIKNQGMNDNMVKATHTLYEALPKEVKDIVLENGFKGLPSLSKPLKAVGNASENRNRNRKKEKQPFSADADEEKNTEKPHNLNSKGAKKMVY